ncbi:MAG: YebC/PmpR family DNA-binding transcriptional regulator [Planctomycetota bacterium]|jgi:YebC/PmpR family DNA-binding regulatory protein|nr:YebC/PmpR family DNA-binding transcriptional regulator [Pirellula sp.]MCY2999746.1 YebC/PmpR family DNA-binding transcriptional regulator [Planctomycetota bacterium]RLS70957.1 MAG: YebC/PmpR family DNA-binding transcriptional regulator [Planctomycetota bacterium]
MAGHSQWANIKHRKALVDSKRSKLWSKLSKAIIVAAKLGGGDPANNIRLRTAILDAKAVSLPKDNIDRAIKKGTGEIEGGDVEEVLYEGYGPGGVAILCDIMTDNRNRTAPEVRKLFENHGGNLGSTNCVAYLFERKGLISISKTAVDLEKLMELALENGADDVTESESGFEVTCQTDVYTELVDALESAQIALESKQVTRVPNLTVEVDSDTAVSVMKLLDKLEDHDDVQSVATNVNFTAEQLQSLQS